MFRTNLIVLLTALLLVAGAAGAQAVSPQPVAPDTPAGPWSFGIRFPDDAPVSDFEWELELELDTRDFRAVFDHYDRILLDLGFRQTDLDVDSDEVEAEYRLGELEAELEVELEGSRTEVELEIEGRSRGGQGLFAQFGGLNAPLYPAAVLELEWEVELKHDTRDHRRIFSWYDDGLLAQGWERVSIDRDSDETEAEYVLDGMKLELEVEQDGNRVEVEFELEL